MSNLNPHQFVHYSNQEFKPGDVLTPPSARGAEPNEWSRVSKVYSPDHVYVAHPESLDDLGFHVHFGKHAYAVEPTGPVERDPECRPGSQHLDPDADNYDPYGPLQYRTTGARVVKHVSTF